MGGWEGEERKRRRKLFVERINSETRSLSRFPPHSHTLPSHPHTPHSHIPHSHTHIPQTPPCKHPTHPPPHTLPHRVFPYLCRSVRNFVRDRGGVSVSKEFYVAFEDVPTRHKYVEDYTIPTTHNTPFTHTHSFTMSCVSLVVYMCCCILTVAMVTVSIKRLLL